MTVDRNRVELAGHPTQSGTTIQGWSAIFIGMLFFAVGGFVTVVALAGLVENRAPPLVIATIGVVFALAGLLIVTNAIGGFRAKARRQRSTDRIAGDHPWDRAEARHNAVSGGVTDLLSAMFMALFLVPFNWWAFVSDESVIFVVIIVGIFDVILAFIVGNAIYLFIRGLKYGTSVLKYDRFPFNLGQRLTAELVCPRRIESQAGIEVVLRCVEEMFEVRGSGRNRKSVVICWQTYADTQKIDARAARGRDGTSLRLSFDLPADGAETQLSQRPPTYWEIEVRSETPGVDYGATFLVPVYRA